MNPRRRYLLAVIVALFWLPVALAVYPIAICFYILQAIATFADDHFHRLVPRWFQQNESPRSWWLAVMYLFSAEQRAAVRKRHGEGPTDDR